MNRYRSSKDPSESGIPQSRRRLILLGSVLAVALIGGCAGEEQVQVKGGADLETAAAQGAAKPSVTVKSNPNPSVYSGLKLEKIDELEHTLGGIWLDDTHIIVQKPDPEAEPVWIGETKMPPYSLYIRDLDSGEEELLHGGDGLSWGAPLLSPDGGHLFMLNDSGNSGIPYLLEMKSRKLTKIAAPDGKEYVSSQDAGWLGSDHIVYAKEGEPDIYGADLSGTETRIADTDGKRVMMHSLQAASDGRIYYGLADTDWGMYAYDPASKSASPIGSPFPSLVPSPDGTQLAVVKRIGDTQEELLLTDPSGKEIKKLADGKGFFGTGWSPDGKRLAYTVTASREAGRDGFYIADAGTGQSFLLSPDLADAGDRMKWSPSGTKIMVTKSERLNGELVSTTTVITVSW